MALRKFPICLLIILGIAAFFRLWQLNSIPSGLYPDVALNGNEATQSLKVFYPENNGREGMMMWLIAASFSVFGVSIWSIKIVAAVSGILTVLGLYLLTKELFIKYAENISRHIALLSSFFLATSFWHTNFSRIGFRAILLPLVSVFAFYFLFRGFRTKKLLSFILSGLFFGLGFYTYTSYRMIILLFPLLLICLPFFKKDKKVLLLIGYWLLIIFVVALPIGLYFLHHPQDFISRATGVSIFSQPNPLLAFAKSLIAHLGMFNFSGDQNWRHNFAGSPMIPWPIGILFLSGIILSIKDLIRSIKTRSHSLLMVPAFLLTWFFVMLLPGILTYEGVPHALRVIGVIPVVYIFAGFGGWKIYQFLSQNTQRKKLLIFASFFFLLSTGFSEFNKYFVKWAQNPNVQGAFTADYVKIGNYLNSLPDNVQKYVIVNEGGTPVPLPNGLPMPAQTPMFIERTKYGEPRAIYLRPEDLNQVKNKENTIIIFMRPQ